MQVIKLLYMISERKADDLLWYKLIKISKLIHDMDLLYHFVFSFLLLKHSLIF